MVRLPSTGLVTLGETLQKLLDQVRRMTRALARSCLFAKENKARVVPIVKRSLRLDDDLVTKIFDYHKPVETPDGRIDANLMADTIRHSSQADEITKEKRCR